MTVQTTTACVHGADDCAGCALCRRRLPDPDTGQSCDACWSPSMSMRADDQVPPMPPTLTEAEWTQRVTDLARDRGWRLYRGSGRVAGWPDLVMIRDDRWVAAELKSTAGKLRPGQTEWLAALAGVGAETYVWRPGDWAAVVRTLS